MAGKGKAKSKGSLKKTTNRTTEIVLAAPRAVPAARPQVTYLAAPPPAPKRSLAKRAGSAALAAAVQEKELVSTLMTAGVIGYLDQEGWLQDLPEPESVPIGKKGVFAVLAFAGAKYLVKDPSLRKILLGASTAAGSIAMYDLVKGWTAKRQLEKSLTPKAAGDLDDDDSAGV